MFTTDYRPLNAMLKATPNTKTRINRRYTISA